MLLKVDSINKSFGAVRASKGVSFDLRAGEVHALVGENGARQITLIKIITGALQPDGPDSGSLFINGRHVVENSPSLARRLGVAAIYQRPRFFPICRWPKTSRSDWSGADCGAVLIGAGGTRAQGNCSIASARESIRNPPAGALTMPEQQLVEIARALGSSPEGFRRLLQTPGRRS